MSPKSLRAKTDIWPALLRRAMKGYEQYELLLELGQIFNPRVEALIENRLASWEVFGGRACFYESRLTFTKNECLFSTFSRMTEVAYNRPTLLPICIAQHWMLLLVVPPKSD
jgi:hypothetical protein